MKQKTEDNLLSILLGIGVCHALIFVYFIFFNIVDYLILPLFILNTINSMYWIILTYILLYLIYPLIAMITIFVWKETEIKLLKNKYFLLGSLASVIIEFIIIFVIRYN